MAGHWEPLYYANAPVAGAFDMQSLSFGTYPMIQVVGAGIQITTDQNYVAMQYRVGGALISGLTDYDLAVLAQKNAAVQDEDLDEDEAYMLLTLRDTAANALGNASDEHMGFQAFISMPASTTLEKLMTFQSQWLDSAGAGWRAMGAGRMQNTGAIDGIKIFGQSNLTAGRVSILGLKTS